MWCHDRSVPLNRWLVRKQQRVLVTTTVQQSDLLYSAASILSSTDDEHFVFGGNIPQILSAQIQTQWKTEAESMSSSRRRVPRFFAAAAVSDDIVNSFLKSSVLHRYSDDIWEKAQKNAQQSIQSRRTPSGTAFSIITF